MYCFLDLVFVHLHKETWILFCPSSLVANVQTASDMCQWEHHHPLEPRGYFQISLFANIFKDLKHCHKVHYSWRAFNQAIFFAKEILRLWFHNFRCSWLKLSVQIVLPYSAQNFSHFLTYSRKKGYSPVAVCSIQVL